MISHRRRYLHRKRRIRKKWCIGEFTVFGFDVMGSSAFTKTFIDEVIAFADSHGFGFGGWHNKNGQFSFFVTGHSGKLKRVSLDDTHRKLVLDWFNGRGDVTELMVCDLVDIWE